MDKDNKEMLNILSTISDEYINILETIKKDYEDKVKEANSLKLELVKKEELIKELTLELESLKKHENFLDRDEILSTKKRIEELLLKPDKDSEEFIELEKLEFKLYKYEKTFKNKIMLFFM